MVQDQDDQTIPSATVVWRRIPASSPNRWVVADHNTGRLRPSSQAFKDNNKGPMSMYIAEECGGTESLLAGLEGFAVAALTVELLRDCGLGIVRDPEHGGPGHCLVTGRKTDGVRDRLAKASQWVVPPPDA